LFIAVDDLRPELGVYDWKHAPKTPNLDKFAESALVFKNAYIQYSFCCPSR
jgi:arylsulfatase A-like enzyme